jgi:NADPH:quinone reductase-like Zn-dependent oxidoreductase
LYRLGKPGSLDALQRHEEVIPKPGLGQVTVRIRAASLNHRDLNIVSGGYTSVPLKPNAIPLSDGAGEVSELGPGVTRWKVGDRVAPIFVQRWIGGELLPEYMLSALGGPSDGVLAEHIVLGEEGLVRIPAHMSFEQAATLPCAAVTAWNAALVQGRLEPGQTIVTLGTGGVSLFAIQIALLAGARVIATTGSEQKVERLRKLGVHEVIDYRSTPEWGARVRELTDGRGADLVVEVGGPGTLANSITAIPLLRSHQRRRHPRRQSDHRPGNAICQARVDVRHPGRQPRHVRVDGAGDGSGEARAGCRPRVCVRECASGVRASRGWEAFWEGGGAGVIMPRSERWQQVYREQLSLRPALPDAPCREPCGPVASRPASCLRLE